MVRSTPPCDTTFSGSYVGHCSDDRVRIWHGHADPAISCGRHASWYSGGGPTLAVFDGHRVRMAREASRKTGEA